MATVIDSAFTTWTAADLVARFGAIPLNRVRADPGAGRATEKDVFAIHDRENRLYELVDGVLLEKTSGAFESYLACVLIRVLGNYVETHNLGIVLGPDGMIRIAPGLIRIPDVCFVSARTGLGSKLKGEPALKLVPDLAIEILSASNTHEEMARKLREYFEAGVRLVWNFYPNVREVHVYVATDQRTVLKERDTLNGDAVLPGFEMSLAGFFDGPEDPSRIDAK